jgi:hypothetical protein
MWEDGNNFCLEQQDAGAFESDMQSSERSRNFESAEHRES